MKIAAYLGKSVYIESIVQLAACTDKGKPTCAWQESVTMYTLPGRPRPTRMGELEYLVDRLGTAYYLSEAMALKAMCQHVAQLEGLLRKKMSWDEEAMSLRKQVFAV